MALRLCQFLNKHFGTFHRVGSRNRICFQSLALASTKKPEEYVVMTDDGSTVVCWHPEPSFPYECTRPLPDVTPEPISVLNVPLQAGVSSLMKKKSEEAVRQELMKITHTTKHRWFPRSRDKYFKKIPQNREYL